MIRIECPKCQETGEFEDEDAGRVAACDACGKKVRLPSAESSQGVSDERSSAPPPRKKVSRHDDYEDDGEDPPRRNKKDSAKILGRRERVFQPRKEALRLWLVVSLVAVAGGLVCFLMTLMGKMNEWFVVGFMFVLPAGVCGSLWCLNFLTLKVALHEGGIVHSHRGARRVIPWEEIVGVTQAINEVHNEGGGHITTTYKYTLELGDGKRIVYTNYRLQKVSALADEIIERTAEILLPRARKDYGRGEEVGFGPLSVSEEGLGYGEKLLEWRDIKGVKIKEGYISVSKRGKWLKWCNIAASSIPNLSVFLALVDGIVGVDAG